MKMNHYFYQFCSANMLASDNLKADLGVIVW